MIRKRHQRARRAKLEKDNGMYADEAHKSGWTVNDNNNNTNRLSKIADRILDEADPDDDESSQKRPITVPLTITMLIIAAYIWFGSLIFHRFEDWTMTQAGYFCFITLGMKKMKVINLYEIFSYLF